MARPEGGFGVRNCSKAYLILWLKTHSFSGLDKCFGFSLRDQIFAQARAQKPGAGSPGSLSGAMKSRARGKFGKAGGRKRPVPPPYYYNPGKLLFRRYIPGNPVLWHAAQKCSTDAGLWSGEKHLQEQKQHRFSGLECFSTQESKIFWAPFFHLPKTNGQT